MCRHAIPHRLFMSGFRPASLTACPPREPPPLFEQEHRNPKELTVRQCIPRKTAPLDAGSEHSSRIATLRRFKRVRVKQVWISPRLIRTPVKIDNHRNTSRLSLKKKKKCAETSKNPPLIIVSIRSHEERERERVCGDYIISTSTNIFRFYFRGILLEIFFAQSRRICSLVNPSCKLRYYIYIDKMVFYWYLLSHLSARHKIRSMLAENISRIFVLC